MWLVLLLVLAFVAWRVYKKRAAAKMAAANGSQEPAPSKAPKFGQGTGVLCSICLRPQANSTCTQCGKPVCPSHNHYINGRTYCMRCKVLCPRCKSELVQAVRPGPSTGRVLGGTILGGVTLGALVALADANRVEYICLACGNRWQPRIT